MSYLAIARKYRPATFADIVGQEHVVRTLENALTSGRIHHAFLFTGARGVGKTTAARALAKALNCVNGPTPTPCGSCTSCVEIAAGSSPDLVEIDGASNNSVEDVRELRETVHYAPTRGKYKVYLVDEVHMLSKAAFNALLKTLEEPPPHVVFIFATTEPNRILDTILSRVQRFDFRRIGLEPVRERLAEIAAAEGVRLSDRSLRAIARAGEGSMRDAQSLLDKVISFAAGKGEVPDELVAETLGLIDRGLLFTFAEGLVAGEPERCLDAIAKVYDYGHELSQFTSDLLELFRNATFLRLSAGARKHVDLAADEIERLEKLVADVPPDALTRTFNALLDVHDQVSRAARPRIVLEMAVARLATVRPVEPVSGLLARLEELERRLRTGGGAPPSSGQRTVRPRGASAAPKPAPRQVEVKPAPPAREARDAAPPAPKPAPPAPKPAPQAPKAAPPARPAAARVAPERAAPPPRADDELDRMSASVPVDAIEDDFVARWKELGERLRKLPPPAPRLAEARAELRDRVLQVWLPGGRPLAEGRKAAASAEVKGAVISLFPRVETIEVFPVPGTSSPAEEQKAMQREVLDDPDCRRIIQKLGAELETVVPLRDDPENA